MMISQSPQISQSPSLSGGDLEKIDREMTGPGKSATIHSRLSSTSESNLSVVIGRPDIRVGVGDIVAGTGAHEKTIVAACGPAGLTTETRRVVAALVSTQDRNVTLHCEQFGW